MNYSYEDYENQLLQKRQLVYEKPSVDRRISMSFRESVFDDDQDEFTVEDLENGMGQIDFSVRSFEDLDIPK